MYEYPSDNDILPQQEAYIEAYIDSFENALYAPTFLDPQNGYKKFIDLQSFVDFFILNEACKNVDAYRISTFLYKKKITKGNKLFVGPAWDYNIAFWNADYCQGNLYTGWQYQFNNICGNPGDFNVPFWWSRFLQDPVYTSMLRCRWDELRLTVLNTDTLFSKIDEVAALIDEAKDRHFLTYPILGVPVWANPQPVASTYAGEIINMKNWIQQRMTWLDANMPGVCSTGLEGITSTNKNVYVYPNPFHDQFMVRFNLSTTGDVRIMIDDVTGRNVYERSAIAGNEGMNEVRVDCRNLTPGMYMVKIISGSTTYNTRLIAK
jgi:hypothetical protein